MNEHTEVVVGMWREYAASQKRLGFAEATVVWAVIVGAAAVLGLIKWVPR